MSEDNGAVIYVKLLSEAVSKVGRPFPTAVELRGHIEKAGFVDVQQFSFKQPWGPWPRDKKLKQAGGLFLLQAETGKTPSLHGCGTDELTGDWCRIRGLWSCAADARSRHRSQKGC